MIGVVNFSKLRLIFNLWNFQWNQNMDWNLVFAVDLVWSRAKVREGKQKIKIKIVSARGRVEKCGELEVLTFQNQWRIWQVSRGSALLPSAPDTVADFYGVTSCFRSVYDKAVLFGSFGPWVWALNILPSGWGCIFSLFFHLLFFFGLRKVDAHHSICFFGRSSW